MPPRTVVYSLDRYWLPWSDEPPEEDPDSSWRVEAKRETLRKEEEPGLLLFRDEGAKSELLVFLVGETPIEGINKVQFSRAVDYVLVARQDPCARQPCEILVAGPTFSGSVASVKQAVSEIGKRRQVSFRMLGGWTTDWSAIREMKQSAAGGPRVRFGTTLADDRSALTELLGYLQGQRVGVQQDEIALISENETSYGINIFSWWSRQSAPANEPAVGCPTRHSFRHPNPQSSISTRSVTSPRGLRGESATWRLR